MTRRSVTRGLILMAAAGILAGMYTTALADDPTRPVKWSQLPNMETGIDYNSMRDLYICADDFMCTDPRPVIDVHWWGSYWSGSGPQPIEGFIIRFFSNIIEQYSQPDVLLYEEYIPGNCRETFYGYSSYDGTDVYQYNCDLPRPFDQVPNEIYWISIQVDPGWDGYPNWGWHNSIDHWEDDAVQATEPEPWGWNEIVHPDGYSDDLAFELSVPEPATLSLLVLGGLALVRRRRK